MMSENGKGINQMRIVQKRVRMVQKKGVSANEYRRGVFAHEERAEERVLAYEEYVTAWLDEGPKMRCWPTRRGQKNGIGQ